MHAYIHTYTHLYIHSVPLLVGNHSSSGWWLCFRFYLDLVGVISLGNQKMSVPSGSYGKKCWCLDPILPSRPGSCAPGSSLAESRLASLLCLQWQVTAYSPLPGTAELVWLQACLQNPPCRKPWHEKVFHWVSDIRRGVSCRILQVQNQFPLPPKDLWDQSCYLKVLLNRAQTKERTWEEIARWGRGAERGL